MPVYIFECERCRNAQFERTFHISECPKETHCPLCGHPAKKIIAPVAIQCDSAIDVPWLESACQTLLPDDHRPLETRGEYKRYLKENHVIERC